MNIKYNQIVVLDARMINMSGIGRYIQALIPAFIQNFSEITLLGVLSEIKKFDWAEKIKVIELNDHIYSINEQISIFLKTPKCDIFIAPHYNAPIYLPQAKKIAVIIPDTNHLVFRNDLSLMKRLYAQLFYKIAINKDIIFTISDFSKSEIVKFTNCASAKIIVAKLAIDKEHFKKLDQEIKLTSFPEFEKYQSSNYILYIGNIKPHKNLKRALLAFVKAAINYPDLRFLIVGKKDNFLTGDNEVFDLVKQNNYLTEKVDFTGHVSDLHLAFLYKHAKLFLFPTLYEGFGLPPLEAMFFGCPIIVSKEGSLPEICGDAAYYCNAYDIDDIAKAITTIMLNKNLREKLIDKGVAKVNEYDWSVFTTAVVKGLLQ
ncbi:glycosyltransferase family 1 protein [Mucilaginibacter sp.]|uniref:glycosyltransferase family 4 protein n=1 Tax=Mucilaginibacter sp. TaxID=1882438 RepID=UPI00261AB414|nr:glycosyltransferase family 1 protein [Mucilaginibacter sp.]MDB4926293.1 glycosyl transferase, group 1 [Mucilaginibacter sp.]